MRIALISQEYPPETGKGGLGTQTYLKAHGLAARGHQVFVISRSTDGTEREYQDGPVQVMRLPGLENELPLYTDVADWITYSSRVASALAARYASGPVDLLDFPDWAAEGYVHLLNQSDWNRTPAVIQLHGPLAWFARELHWPSVDSEFFRTGSAMEATCLRLADGLYASSQQLADFAIREYQLTRSTIPVIHSGVDTTLFTPGHTPKASRPTIVFAGRIAHHKGVFRLIEAALALTAEFPDLQLRLLGRAEPTIVRELTRRAVAAGHPNLVHAGGFLLQKDLSLELQHAHVLAAPAAREPGPGLAYLEAMACGLPVVACSGSGAAEVVTHEKTGLLVPPGDHQALAEALRQLLANTMQRETMGQEARRYVEQHADSERCLDQLERFYESVAHRWAAVA